MLEEEKTVYIGIELDRQAQSTFATSIDNVSSRLKATFASVQDSIKDDTRAIDEMRASLTGAASDAENLQKASSGFGVEGLRRTGGALTQLGLGEIGAPVARIGDIAQVGKELGKVTEQITAMSGATEPLIAGLSAGTVALGAVAAAGAVFVGGLALIKNAYQDASKGIEEGISRLDAYYQALESGDAKTIASKKAQLEITQKYSDEELAVLKTAKEKGFDAAQQAYGDLAARILTGLGATGLYGDSIKKIDDRIAELAKQSTDLTGQIAGLTDAYNSQTMQAQLATEAVLAEADATKAQYLQDYQDSQLSADSGKKKAEQIKATIDADAAEIEQLKASGDQTQEVKDKIAALTKEAFDLDAELQKLNNVFIPAAQHAGELADKIKAADKAITERADAQSKADDRRVQDMAAAVAKADDDITKITEQGLQKKIDIEKKYQDALVKAAEQAVQAAEDALRKLQDQRAELFTGLQRDELDATRKAQYDDLEARIKGQAEEAKSLREHLDRLQDIRRNAQQQDVQNILDRNFLAIFQNQLSTRSALESENIGYGRTQREQIISEQQASQDAARQRAFDHEQRLIAYEQANQDARRQYEIQLRDNQIAEQRSIAQARQAKATELQDLSMATNQALSIRRQGLIAELQLITRGEEQKLALQQQFYQRALNYLNSATRGAGTTNNYYAYAPNTARGELLQATARQTTQIVRQAFSVSGQAVLVSS